MRSFPLITVLVAVTYFKAVIGVAPTDEYRDADQAQSGYLPDHNMDPAVVDSSTFGQLWKIPFNSQEQVKRFPHNILTTQGFCSFLELISSTQSL